MKLPPLVSWSTIVAWSALAALVARPAIADEPAMPEPVGKLTPPPGWEPDLGRSAGFEMAVGREDHFGGVRVHVSAQHLRAPSPGGILLTSEVASEALPADAAAAATAELHGIRSGLDSLGDTVKVVRWDVHADPASKVTEGRLEWSDASLGTTSISRTLVFQTGGRLVRLSAECIIAADAGGLRAPCEAALATLTPLAPVATRDALAVATTAPAAPVADGAAPRPGAPVGGGGGPTISEREGGMPVTIVVDSPKPKRDRRPYYVAGGLVVILAVYLFNRRNRQRATAAADEPKDEPKDEERA